MFTEMTSDHILVGLWFGLKISILGWTLLPYCVVLDLDYSREILSTYPISLVAIGHYCTLLLFDVCG